MRTPPVSYQVRNSNLSLLTDVASNEMVRPPAPLALAIVMRLWAYGSISTPGLSNPSGSKVALAALSAAANNGGRWRSYHGRWSRPTA